MTASTGDVPGRIFMSYRREDTSFPAGWLYDRLVSRFGRDQVFKDIDSIELGDDFIEVITTAVGSCDVLLALIGDRWLTITGQDGRRRLDNPDDFVRLEIEAALSRNVRVIPILVDAAQMPSADELPPSLARLARRQALELSPNRFDTDTRRLLRVLDRTVAGREMKREEIAGRLLVACSVRLDTDTGPQGTAFFVAPGFAVTAAHVVGGVNGLGVRLSEGLRNWRGHVVDVRPSLAREIAATSPYPAPDVALIEVDEGPRHPCALLAKHSPTENARVMARSYTRTLDQQAVTAETETFQLTGTLETTDPDCKLLKLGLGEATHGMSGGPVLDLRTGEVIGMLRTSRKLGSNLGGWVVPAGLIRLLWPEEVGLANDRFHEQYPLWRETASQLRGRQSADSTRAGPSIRTIKADVVSVINGDNNGSVNIEYGPGNGRHGSGTR